eukprot:4112794-Amphidinium_carterae.1
MCAHKIACGSTKAAKLVHGDCSTKHFLTYVSLQLPCSRTLALKADACRKGELQSNMKKEKS